MAIERVAQNYDFGSAPQAGAVPINVGNAPMDVNKFADGSRSNAPTNGLLDNIIGAVLPTVNKMADKELSNAREEAYLSAASAAGAGLAQNEVDSNIFTKDWATAGYRDTRGRLAQADAEAQTALDMDKLREQSPTEFQDYLAKRREKLMPSLEGMSLDARKAFLAQQLTSDRAAIAKQATEHQKFIIDQTATSIQSGFSTSLDVLTKARSSEAAYLTQADSTWTNFYGNVWGNSTLPKADRLKLTEQAATLALAQNHQILYEKMRDEKIPGGGSLLSQLPFDSQVKLATAYETSLKDTAAMRLGNFAQQWGMMQATISDPLGAAVSHDDFAAMADQAVQNGFIKTPQERAAAEKQWAEGQRKKLESGDLAKAFSTGDVGRRYVLGKTEQEGADAFIQMNARNNVPVAQTMGQLLQIGLTTGQSAAFSSAGNLVKSAVSMIGSGATIDPNQLDMLNTTFKTLDDAEQKGNKNAMTAFLGAFPDSDRAKLMMYRETLQRTGNPQVAAQIAADTAAKASQLTETERNVRTAGLAGENQKIIDAVEPRGLWGDIKAAIIPNIVRSESAVKQDELGVSAGWFNNPETMQAKLAQSKNAVREELNYISRSNPDLSADSRARMAYAAVADRTVQTADGPVVLPHLMQGTTANDFFGVAASIPKDVIGQGISSLHTAAKGNSTIYKIDGLGRLAWEEHNKGNGFVSAGTLDPKDVAAAIQDKMDARSEEFQATNGKGVTLKGATGVPVTFNGNNTAGAQNTDMLDFRKSLVKHESVTDTPYEDLSGKVVNGKKVQTVGVGVSSHNPHFPDVGPDGKVAPAAINESFMRASNDAAVSARSAQQRLNLPNSSAFKLLAEMSYQGGGKFYNVDANKGYVQALQEHNVDKALASLKDTMPYKMSGAERQKYYEDMTRKALGGTPTQTATNQTPNPFN